MTRVRALGFDLDGTLFDHRGSAEEGVRAFLQLLGVEPDEGAVDLWFAAEEVEFERWRSGRIGFQEQWRRRLRTVLTALEVAFDDEPAQLDHLFEEYLREYRSAWRAFPDAAGVLSSLRSRGFALGVLTNGNEEQQMSKLRQIGILEMVDVVCILESIGAQKPDDRAFALLAEGLGVPPRECAFIGDNPQQDVPGAGAAGMRTALIERYREGADDLEAVVDQVVASIL